MILKTERTTILVDKNTGVFLCSECASWFDREKLMDHLLDHSNRGDTVAENIFEKAVLEDAE